MDDEYFFEFVVGPPVEYLLLKIEQESQERATRVPVPKPKSKTMWDLPDPFVPKEE